MIKNKASLGYIAIIAMLLAASVASLNLFTRDRTSHDKLNINSFPLTLGEWKGRDLPLTDQEFDILETRNVLSREYVNLAGEKLFLLVIYSETNRSVFHPPEVCLIGSGMNMVDKQVETIPGVNKNFTTNKLFLEKDGQKEITLYSYKAGDMYTDNFYLQQIYLMFHQVFGKRVPGATVRVSKGISGDEGKAEEAMKSFMAEAVKSVDKLCSKLQ